MINIIFHSLYQNIFNNILCNQIGNPDDAAGLWITDFLPIKEILKLLLCLWRISIRLFPELKVRIKSFIQPNTFFNMLESTQRVLDDFSPSTLVFIRLDFLRIIQEWSVYSKFSMLLHTIFFQKYNRLY